MGRLNLQVRPGDRFFIGTSAVTVLIDHIVDVAIEGDTPVLRAADYVDAAEVSTADMRLRYAIQQMFLTGDIASHHNTYFAQAHAFCHDHPNATGLLAEINGLLMQGKTYRAIKLAKALSDTQVEFRPPSLRLVR